MVGHFGGLFFSFWGVEAVEEDFLLFSFFLFNHQPTPPGQAVENSGEMKPLN